MACRCFLCGKKSNLELHHLLRGSQRKMADKYKLTVYLCHDCHRQVHDEPELMKECRREGQRRFEKEYSREEFIKVFGKNYLGDEEDCKKTL